MAEHPNAPRCHHVHVNGLRCGSPAMRHANLCYFHKKTTGPVPHPKAELPNLEDGNAVQLAIAHLARQVIQGAIEYRAAHILTDIYRLALRNLKNMRTEPCNFEDLTTFDPHMENTDFYPADTSAEVHLTEPISHDEEQEMIEAGTLSTRTRTLPSAEQGNAAVNHQRDAVAQPAAALEKRETRNEKPFDQLSEKEREAHIMRACGNKAYFMKEEDMPKAPPAPDFDDIMAEIRKELAAG